MKIIYLADTSNIHTQKWVNHFLEKGHEIICISLSKKEINGTRHVNILNDDDKIPSKNLFQKIFYLRKIKFIKDFINKEQPDILHAHYASSYGLLGSLCNYHPFIISVWGADIFDFPKKNIITKKIIEFNLKKADVICSTSNIMAKEIMIYTKKKIFITPFGVNTNLFYPKKNLNNKIFKIGTVKSLEHKYGIDILIRAFKIFNDKYKNSFLEIVGEGTQRKVYEKLVKSLSLENNIVFKGKIDNNNIPDILNTFDVFLALSRYESESFGVAVVEAMSCGIPLIASSVSGFLEVVINNETGLLVKIDSIEDSFDKLEYLYNNKDFSMNIAKKAREHVLLNYDWSENVKIMENIYMNVCLKK